MTITDQMGYLARGEFWLLASVALGLALAGFYFAFRYLARARRIEDAPTARIRSAHQGYVELEGRVDAGSGTLVSAPLTGRLCCWYRYRIEKQFDRHWRTVERATSDAPFLLRDETGVCIVDPKGAEVTPAERSLWYGHQRRPHGEPSPSGLSTSLLVLVRGRYRYTEERIEPGDPLYAIGHFKSQDDLDRTQSRDAMSRALLRQWKSDQANLVARFDRDRNGRIDAGEWEQVRRAAAERAARNQREQAPQRVPHLLSKPRQAQEPFLLSCVPQRSLARRYRVKAAVSSGAFLVSGSLAVWMIFTRLWHHTPIG